MVHNGHGQGYLCLIVTMTRIADTAIHAVFNIENQGFGYNNVWNIDSKELNI